MTKKSLCLWYGNLSDLTSLVSLFSLILYCKGERRVMVFSPYLKVLCLKYALHSRIFLSYCFAVEIHSATVTLQNSSYF